MPVAASPPRGPSSPLPDPQPRPHQPFLPANPAEAARAAEEPARSSVRFCQERRLDTRNELASAEESKVQEPDNSTESRKTLPVACAYLFSFQTVYFNSLKKSYIHTHARTCPCPVFLRGRGGRKPKLPPPKQHTAYPGSWPMVTSSHLRKGSSNTLGWLKPAPRPPVPKTSSPSMVRTGKNPQRDQIRQKATNPRSQSFSSPHSKRC